MTFNKTTSGYDYSQYIHLHTVTFFKIFSHGSPLSRNKWLISWLVLEDEYVGIKKQKMVKEINLIIW